MEFRILGPLEIRDGDHIVEVAAPKQREVLGLLLLHPGQALSTDRILDTVWHEEPPSSGAKTLRYHVSKLRATLAEQGVADDLIVTRSPGYVIDVAPERIDAGRFEQLVHDGRDVLGADPAKAEELLDEALGLWRGRVLADFQYAEWARSESVRLEELRLSAVEDRLEAILAQGRQDEAIPYLEGLVSSHPFRERLTMQLMVALYRADRQAEALRAYRRVREALVEELGVEPSDDLRRLEQRILEQDEGLLAVATGPSPRATVGGTVRGYELRERVAEGSFGVIFRAYQTSVGREVAVKLIKPEFADHPDFIRRFEREAQLVARLEHPHIVPLYDFWREPGRAYLVMRWIPGGSVGDALAHGPFRLERAVELIGQIGDALNAAHRRGVVHRDLKPGNLLLDRDGHAYLSDFGIAKELEAGATLTGTGVTPGSPAYMAPEQIEGEPVSPATDVYGLGIVLYEMVTGRHPFAGDSVTSVIDKQLRQPLPPVAGTAPGLTEAIDAVIAKATAKQPRARYPDAPALARALRRAAEAAAVPGVRAAVVAANPYKGLSPFAEADAADFFGRDDEVARVVERIEGRAGRFIAVVGPSGAGKSSLVRAGLIPALRRGAVAGSERWFIADMLPGHHPMEELEAALLRVAVNPPASLLQQLTEDATGLRRAVKRILPEDTSELVLLIDQFEELFTLVEDPAQRRRFLDALMTAVNDDRSRLRVVVTLRADFFDRPLLYADFGRMLRTGLDPITPMTAHELERAIAGPAERVGVTIEPALVARIVAETADQPAALPLLQYAMTELFERRTGDVITREVYDEIGGVLGALGRRAEELYRSLDDAEREAAHQLFLRLVTLGEGTEDTRRRVPLAELAGVADSHLDHVTDELGRYRLLTFDRDPVSRAPTVEVAHEALLREWPRLRQWVESSRADLRTHRRLAAAAAEWEAAGGDPGYLLSDARLAEFVAWRERSEVALTDAEAQYLDSSSARKEEQDRLEEERAARERALEEQAARRRNVLLVVMSVAAVVAAVLAVWAVGKSREAQRQTRLAQSRELAVQAIDAIETDPDLALLLAAEAVEIPLGAGEDVPVEALDAIHRALAGQRLEYRQAAELAAVAGDGSMVATVEGTMVMLRDLAEGVGQGSFSLGYPPTALALADGGSTIAVGDAEGRIHLLSPDGTEQRTLDAHADSVGFLRFTGGGEYLASSGADGLAKVWTVATGEATCSKAHSGDGVPIATSDAGTTLVMGSAFSTASVWASCDAPSSAPLGNADVPVTAVAAAPSGEWVAVGDAAGSVWASQVDGARIVPLSGHAAAVRDVVFLPATAGPRIATASDDGTVRVWDVESAAAEIVLGHEAAVESVGGADGDVVMATAGGQVYVWNIGPAGSRESLAVAMGEPITSVASIADGDRIAVATGSNRVAIVDAETGNAVRDLSHVRGATLSELAAAADADVLAAAGVRAVVASRGEGEAQELEYAASSTGMGNRPPGVAVSRDGSLVAGSSPRQSLTVWPATGGEGRPVAGSDGALITAVAFSPDGALLVSGDEDGVVQLWEVDSGRRVGVVTASEEAIEGVAFASDGDGVVVAAGDGAALWEATSIMRGEAPSTLLAGHAGTLRDVALSPDGSLLATASADRTVRVWDLDGTEVAVLRAQTDGATSVAFHPSGERLLAGSADGVVREYLLQPEDLLDLARERALRDLTDEECRRYLQRNDCTSGSWNSGR